MIFIECKKETFSWIFISFLGGFQFSFTLSLSRSRSDQEISEEEMKNEKKGERWMFLILPTFLGLCFEFFFWLLLSLLMLLSKFQRIKVFYHRNRLHEVCQVNSRNSSVWCSNSSSNIVASLVWFFFSILFFQSNYNGPIIFSLLYPSVKEARIFFSDRWKTVS